MAQITSGVRAILSAPTIYEAVQKIFGADSNRRRLVSDYIRPNAGDRIIDIGCGPAHILKFMPRVTYVGYDPNPRYIAAAKRTFDGRGEFIAGQYGEREVGNHKPFDIGLVLAVLHHLDDDEATTLFRNLRRSLKPGGRLVTLDNVFIPAQNPIAKLLINMDRGKNVRTADGYAALARTQFDSVKTTVLHKKFPPYTLVVMECR